MTINRHFDRASTIRFRMDTSLVAAIFVCLSGCATPYTPSLDSAGAMLRFKTDTNMLTALSRLDVQSCSARPKIQRVADTNKGNLFGAPTEISELNMIGSSSEEEALIRERRIDSHEPFIFAAWVYSAAVVGSPGFSCMVYGRFEPANDMQYEMTFSIGDRSCSAEVVALGQSTTGEVIRSPELTFVPYRVPYQFGGGPNASGMCDVAFPEMNASVEP